MFMKTKPVDWGKGIPNYNESDLMTKDELYDFALEVVGGYEVKKNGCKPISANPKRLSIPSLVVEIDGKLSFILVEADIAPNMPILSNERKKVFLAYGKQFNANCYYAPVSFGACDSKRFDASLALRGDAFYAKYVGMTLLEEMDADDIS